MNWLVKEFLARFIYFFAWSLLLSNVDFSSGKGCVDCNRNSVLDKRVPLQDNVKEQAGLLACG